MNIFEEIIKAQKSLKAFAIVTVIESQGLGTAQPGKKMIQYADGKHVGTIGGGVFEFECMKLVAKIIAKGKGTEILEFAGVKLFVESFAPTTTIVVVGGGHVGNALLKTAKLLPFATILVDDRDESQIGESIALADIFVKCTDYEEALLSEAIPEGAYIYCGAWSHDFDAMAIKGALQKNPAYLGMVGSHEKVNKIFSHLLAQGLSQEALDTVFTPIGLDIADGSPAEIAFAIMAEMLMIKNKGNGTNCRAITDKFLSSNCESMKVPMGANSSAQK